MDDLLISYNFSQKQKYDERRVRSKSERRDFIAKVKIDEKNGATNLHIITIAEDETVSIVPAGAAQ